MLGGVQIPSGLPPSKRLEFPPMSRPRPIEVLIMLSIDALEYVVLALKVILTGSEGVASPSPVAVTV